MSPGSSTPYGGGAPDATDAANYDADAGPHDPRSSSSSAGSRHGVPRQPAKTLRELPATAQRIVLAAERILVARGYSKLTMQVIEQEASLNRALVSYYFGGKAGLLAALVELLFEDPQSGYTADLARDHEGVELTHALLEYQERVSTNDPTNRMLYELLPHALRSEELGDRFAEEYERYRQFASRCLAAGSDGVDADVLYDLAAVTIAVVEGLAIQKVIDPEGFDHARAFTAWRDLICRHLKLDETPEGD
jgi:AcrR family transcriptional regulator